MLGLVAQCTAVLYLLEDGECDQTISDDFPSIAESHEEQDDRGFDDPKYGIIQQLLCHVQLGGEDLVFLGRDVVGNVPDMIAEPVEPDPVVEDASVGHCERPRGDAKSVICWDSISTAYLTN